ncbi:MAG: hypothetical protein AAGA03_11450 [Planctomycetota bacterium]
MRFSLRLKAAAALAAGCWFSVAVLPSGAADITVTNDQELATALDQASADRQRARRGQLD